MQNKNGQIVHIIDDDPGLRKSLLMLLESSSIAAKAYPSAEEFLSDCDADQTGCILLDLRMPGMSGLELLQNLRSKGNGIPVILMSAHADVPDAVRGMKLGAIDLLQKPVDTPVLIEAIQRSLKLSETIHAEKVESDAVRQRFERLTARELELLTYIAEGHLNKQIAVEMGISVKTVANHRASLMTKSGASNAADLARLFTIYTSYARNSRTPADQGNTLN
ncbi:response regulator FixJ [soil metagenome]